MLSEHKRVKTGHTSGDLPQSTLIRMRESRKPFYAWAWQLMSSKCISAFRRTIRDKGRTVQRRRDKKEIQRSLDDQ